MSEKIKVLVVVASYGHANDVYLARVIGEYRSMPYTTDIVVLSDIPRDLGPGVKVVVGLPDSNPWSLPHGHKQIFADAVEKYDLFIYSEDDHLITQNNIEAFLAVTPLLAEDEIAGFIVSEEGPDGSRHFCGFHGNFHWDARSVIARGPYRLAFFTNEHSGSYLVTQQQLRRALSSGGFLVPPHEGKYDLLCTASTDIYTQCAFRKMICVSRLADFTIRHLPNKYVGRLGISGDELSRQVQALLAVGTNGNRPAVLFETETRLPGLRFSKDYYEPVNENVARLIPGGAHSVLSLGCGSGEIEGWLAKKGLRVVAAPLDPVISASAQSRGVEIVPGGLDAVFDKLRNQRFDCLLLSNVLHLVGDPVNLLARFTGLLTDSGTAIVATPNFLRFSLQQLVRGQKESGYEQSRVHSVSRRQLRNWFQRAGWKVRQIVNVRSPRRSLLHAASLGLLDPLLASEIVVAAHRN